MSYRLLGAIRRCRSCGLHRQCSGPVPPIPKMGGIMVMGRNPGADEDRLGRPFIGKAGQLLDEFLEKAGLSRENLHITNTVKCFTREPRPNRPPTTEEIQACIPWIYLELFWIRPPLIIAVGAEAIRQFDRGATPGNWNGHELVIRREPMRSICKETNSRAFAIFHPAFVLRNGQRDLYWKTAEKLKAVLDTVTT